MELTLKARFDPILKPKIVLSTHSRVTHRQALRFKQVPLCESRSGKCDNLIRKIPLLLGASVAAFHLVFLPPAGLCAEDFRPFSEQRHISPGLGVSAAARRRLPRFTPGPRLALGFLGLGEPAGPPPMDKILSEFEKTVLPNVKSVIDLLNAQVELAPPEAAVKDKLKGIERDIEKMLEDARAGNHDAVQEEMAGLQKQLHDMEDCLMAKAAAATAAKAAEEASTS